MSYDHDGADYEEDDAHPQRTSWFARLRDQWTRNGDDEDYYEDEVEQPQPMKQQPAMQQRHAPQLATEGNVARVPAPSRHAGGSLKPMMRPATVAQLRLERERPTTVTVRRTVQSFEDVRRAVDGLREGIQQIVNIEQTPADIAERLIDFLNGATYALDGSVEKIGTQVYLFTPSSISIDVEDKAKMPASKPFFDRE